MDPDLDDIAERHADVFDAVANPTRLRIFLALALRERIEGPLSYTDLMAAAGMEDSGRFNYHLKRLLGAVIYETGDRYAPTTAGRELIAPLFSGRLVDHDHDLDPATLGATCQQCGRALVARFAYDLYVWCPACHEPTLIVPVSPDVAADADLRTLAADLDRTVLDRTELFVRRRCPDCGGETGVRFTSSDAFDWDGHDERDVLVTVGHLLLGHPTVRAYCREHGIDLDGPSWAHGWVRTDRTTVVRSRDPWEIEKHAYVDGCRMVAVFEADGSVSHVDHVRLSRG